MSKPEAKILSWIDSHMPVIAAVLFTLLGIAARIALRGVESNDYRGCLLQWYEQISRNGLSNTVGNYNFAYQFLIWIFTRLKKIRCICIR